MPLHGGAKEGVRKAMQSESNPAKSRKQFMYILNCFRDYGFRFSFIN